MLRFTFCSVCLAAGCVLDVLCCNPSLVLVWLRVSQRRSFFLGGGVYSRCTVWRISRVIDEVEPDTEVGEPEAFPIGVRVHAFPCESLCRAFAKHG